MKLALVKGTTSYTVYVFIQSSAVTTGAGLTGLAFNTASLTAYYVRNRTTASAITLATQTAAGAFSSGGFVEVDATNLPGIYRLDLPDAVLASGSDFAVVMLKGAANMAPVALEIQLTGADLNDAADLGVTALTGHVPQTGDSFARIGATGSGLTSLASQASVDAVDNFVDTEIADIQARLPAALVGGRMDASVGAIAANAITAASIAADAITDAKVAADVTIASVTGSVGSVASGVTLAANAVDSTAIAASGGEEIADALLNRNVAGGSNVGRLVKHALYRLINRVAIAAGVLTVYGTDDVTAAFTQNVTTSAGNPISEVDTV